MKWLKYPSYLLCFTVLTGVAYAENIPAASNAYCDQQLALKQQLRLINYRINDLQQQVVYQTEKLYALRQTAASYKKECTLANMVACESYKETENDIADAKAEHNATKMELNKLTGVHIRTKSAISELQVKNDQCDV